MANFISDEDMGLLEKKGASKSILPKREPSQFLTDAEMNEVSGKGRHIGEYAQAFAEHAGNQFTFGYLPHIEAGIETLAEGGLEDAQKRYTENRDQNIKRLEQQSKDFPKTTGAGAVTGVLGNVAATAYMAPAAAAAGLVGKLAHGVKAGATFGALSNPGDVAGQVDPLQFTERARGAAIGAAGGAMVPALAATAPALARAGVKVGEKAAQKATRALGRPTPTVAKEMARTGMDKELGRELLDQGAVPVFGSSARIASRVDQLKEKTWAKVEELLAKGGDNAVVDGEAVGIKLLDTPELALLRKTPGAEATVRGIDEAAETFAKSGRMTLKDAQALKRSIDKQINYAKAIPDMKGKQDALFEGRTALRDSMDDAVASLGGNKGELKSAFRKHGRLEKASDIAEREAGRTQANRAVSLTDTIAAGSGLLVGDDPTERAGWSIALGALNKGGRTYGNAMQARALNGASKLLQGSPRLAEAAAKHPVAWESLASQIAQRAAGGPDLGSGQAQPELKNPALMEKIRKNPELIDQIQNPRLREALKKALGQ